MTSNIEIQKNETIRDNDVRRSISGKLRTGKVADVLPDGRIVIDWENGKTTTVSTSGVGTDTGGKAGKYTVLRKAQAA